jgi:hypothetical protein
VPVVVEVSAEHLYRRTDPMVVRRFRIHDEQTKFDRDLHLVRPWVKLNEHVAFLDAVIVIDQDARHLTADAGCDESHVPIHIGVIGRDGVERADYSRDSYEEQYCSHQYAN